MKSVVVVWLTLSETQQTAQFNTAVEDTYNQAMAMFAETAGATIPAIASVLATPALDPRTVVAWSESLATQAEGIVQAIQLGEQKRAELEEAIMTAKGVVDKATNEVNQARIDYVLEAAQAAAQEAPLEIAKSVPPAQS